MKIECQISPNTRQVLAFPLPPTIEKNQTQVIISTTPQNVPVLSSLSPVDKVLFLVVDSNINAFVSGDLKFDYSRRYLTLKTPKLGVRNPKITLTQSQKLLYTTSDVNVYNFLDPYFQVYLNQNSLNLMSGEDQVEFSYRVVRFISNTVRFDQFASINPLSSVNACSQSLCDSKAHALLFVSILRANNIPSRILIGKWVDQEIYEHCRAEFFVENVGWIPVETTEKGDIFEFGVDPKKPFLTSSFAQSFNYNIPSTIVHMYGSSLPTLISLGWLGPYFVYIYGNDIKLFNNVQNWKYSFNTEIKTTQISQTSNNFDNSDKRFTKGHESGLPSVGVYGKPVSQGPPMIPNRIHSNLTQSNSSNQFSQVNSNIVPNNQNPPSVPKRSYQQPNNLQNEQTPYFSNISNTNASNIQVQNDSQILNQTPNNSSEKTLRISKSAILPHKLVLTPETTPSDNSVYNSFKPLPNIVHNIFAKVLFDYNAQKYDELSVSKGEIIMILEKDPSGWWKSQSFNRTGVIPSTYVEIIEKKRIAKTLFQFTAPEEGDLELEIGQYLIILESEGNWWKAESKNKTGSIPFNYIQEIK